VLSLKPDEEQAFISRTSERARRSHPGVGEGRFSGYATVSVTAWVGNGF
jgi:hypothetical protein